MDQSRRPRTDRFTRAHAPANGARVSVVLSTRNDVAALPHVFARLPGDLYEVIVVDRSSSDDTVRIARMLKPEVRIVRHHDEDGDGDGAAALARGRAAASGDIVVSLPADGSSDPAELLRMAGATPVARTAP